MFQLELLNYNGCKNFEICQLIEHILFTHPCSTIVRYEKSYTSTSMIHTLADYHTCDDR